MDTVGRNKKVIAEYIRNQLEEDYAADQISIKEFTDPFTGDKRKQAKNDNRTWAVAGECNTVQNFQNPF